jgi:LPS O-antigen subunit length determinant protein (WzzB/FepE family)
MRILLLLIPLCLAAYLAFAVDIQSSEKEKGPGAAQKAESAGMAEKTKEAPPNVKMAKDMNVQELADAISKALEHNSDIMDYIPGYKSEKDSSGADYYTYNGIRLDKLEKDKLVAMYTRIRQERVRLNTERINRQLDSIRSAQQAASMARQASRVTYVPMPPAQPQQPPQTPPRAVEPPRTPPPAPRR